MNIDGISDSYGQYDKLLKLIYYIKNKNIDICVLIETWIKNDYEENHIKGLLNDYEIIYFGTLRIHKSTNAIRGSGGLAILINNKHIIGKYIATNSDEITRVLCKLGNISFEVIAVYLPPDSSNVSVKNELSLSTIKNIILKSKQEDKLFVCGDFNARTANLSNQILTEDEQLLSLPRSSEDVTYNGKGKVLLSEMNSLNMILLNGLKEKASFTCFRENGRSIVDYIWCRYQHLNMFSELSVHDLNELYNIDSDHCMIQFTFSLDIDEKVNTIDVKKDKKGDTLNNYVKFKWNHLPSNDGRWDLFRESLDEKLEVWIRNFISNHSLCDIDNIYTSWEKCILDTAIKVIGIKRTHPVSLNRTIPYNPEINALIKEKRRLLRCWKITLNHETRVDYNAVNQKIKRLIKKMKLQRCQQNASKIENLRTKDAKLFWNKLKTFYALHNKRQSIPNEVINREGEILSGQKNVLETWTHTYEALFNDSENSLYDESFKQDLSISLLCIKDKQDEVDDHFSFCEIMDATKALKNGKAAGEDGIINEFISKGGYKAAFSLYLLFNLILTRKKIPAQWEGALIIPIHKKDDRRNPLNYRPISLLSVVSKIFTSILNQRINKFLDVNNVLVDEQMGFRENRRTADNIFILYELLNNAKAHKHSVYVAFLDIVKAYDSVWRDGLWSRLQDEGLDRSTNDIIKSIYQNTKNTLLINDVKSKSFTSDVGLRQGCVLSPNLFSIYINDLAKNLKLMEKECGLKIGNDHFVCFLLFADDISLISHSSIGLQKLLNFVEQHSKKFRYEISSQKSKIMFFQHDEQMPGSYYIYNKSIELVHNFKYLGVWFNSKLDWSDHLSAIISSAKRQYNMLVAFQGKTNTLSIKAKKVLYESNVRSILEYASEVWVENNYHDLDSTQYQCLGSILNVLYNSTYAALRGELGIWTIKGRCAFLRLCYFKRLIDSNIVLLTKVAFMGKLNNDHMNTKLSNSWWKYTKSLMLKLKLDNFFADIFQVKCMSTQNWRSLIHKRIHDSEVYEWTSEVQKKPKLRTYFLVKKHFKYEKYLDTPHSGRKFLTRLRCGTNELRIDTGRRKNLRPEDRICLVCLQGVEDEFHFMCECKAYVKERIIMYEKLNIKYTPQLKESMLDMVLNPKHVLSSKIIINYISSAREIRIKCLGEDYDG